MYERFTNRARTVMQTAAQEAQRLQHNYVGTEHILLGLVNEDGVMAADVLKSLRVDAETIRHDFQKLAHIDVQTIRRDIEKLAQERPDLFAKFARLNIDISKIGSELVEQRKNDLVNRSRSALPMGKVLTPRAKNVILYSMEEAKNLKQNVVATGHILLGLLREQEGVACQILMNHGLTLQAVRDKIRVLSQQTEHET